MDSNVIITLSAFIIIIILESIIIENLCARHCAKGFIYILSFNP